MKRFVTGTSCKVYWDCKKRHGTTLQTAEKALSKRQEVSGYDFSDCEIALSKRQEASGYDFTDCEKTLSKRQEASGHDFSRAVSAAK
jgi:hypothetical protein